MKFGSLRSAKSIDGELCLISRDLKVAVNVSHICPNLRQALEEWDKLKNEFQSIDQKLNSNSSELKIFSVNEKDFLSALPRTWLFADGSAFLYHVRLVRKARNAEMPPTLETIPLMYQGECGQFLDPQQDIPQVDFAHGTDFEGEVGVITDFVPMGTSAEDALKYIRLVVLINDVSLRGLIPAELAQGFGFFQSKPASALSPFACTPDELEDSWQGGRVHLPLHVKYNHQFFGQANAGQMHFHFGQLISHAARTRNLAAGSLIGSGTVSNDDHQAGSSCLAEKRMVEQIEKGVIETPFMKPGDHVEIKMLNQNGENLFGTISQTIRSVVA